MNQTEHRSEVVAEAIALAKKADEVRGTAINQLLAQREQIERDLKTLGYRPDQDLNGNGHGHDSSSAGSMALPSAVESAVIAMRKSRRFKGLTLAAVGKLLLREHPRLHGRMIEDLAKAGGFKGGTKNFQNYLPVAFKRDGAFENIGGNTWKLKDSANA